MDPVNVSPIVKIASACDLYTTSPKSTIETKWSNTNKGTIWIVVANYGIEWPQGLRPEEWSYDFISISLDPCTQRDSDRRLGLPSCKHDCSYQFSAFKLMGHNSKRIHSSSILASLIQHVTYSNLVERLRDVSLRYTKAWKSLSSEDDKKHRVSAKPFSAWNLPQSNRSRWTLSRASITHAENLT